MQIRQVFEADDFGPALTPKLRAAEERRRARASANTKQARGGQTMRFMTLVKATKDSEAGVMPNPVGTGREAEIEGRQLFELEDFASLRGPGSITATAIP